MPHMMYDHLVHTLLPHMKINFNEKAILVVPLSQTSRIKQHCISLPELPHLDPVQTSNNGSNNLFACKNSIFTSLWMYSEQELYHSSGYCPCSCSQNQTRARPQKTRKKRFHSKSQITTKKINKMRLPRVYGVLRLSSPLLLLAFLQNRQWGLSESAYASRR